MQRGRGMVRFLTVREDDQGSLWGVRVQADLALHGDVRVEHRRPETRSRRFEPGHPISQDASKQEKGITDLIFQHYGRPCVKMQQCF